MSKFIVGISGAQGAGKSSLLAELAKRGWTLDSFKVSRAVQSQLGWDSLDRVMDSPETMMEFQNEVFEQKYKNDLAISLRSNAMTLTERTFADILAYTSFWTWNFVEQHRLRMNDAMNFLMPFTDKCVKAQDEIYSGVVLLPLMPHVVWEEDANRAKLEDAQTIYEDVEAFMKKRMPLTSRYITISTKTVEERADQVEHFLRGLTQ